MSERNDGDVKDIINFWKEKAEDSLYGAVDDLNAKRYSFAVSRLYYACFYIVSALLFKNKLQFKKHSGVKSAFHLHFIKTKLISSKLGDLYDLLYFKRQKADYVELVSFGKSEVEEWLKQAREFVDEIKKLISEE